MNQSACSVVVVIVAFGIAIAAVVNGQTPSEALSQTASLDAASSGPAFAGRAVLTGENLTQLSATEPVKPAAEQSQRLEQPCDSPRSAMKPVWTSGTSMERVRTSTWSNRGARRIVVVEHALRVRGSRPGWGPRPVRHELHGHRTEAHSPFCGNASSKKRFYSHPLNFEPLANVVLRNNENSTFSDVSAASGIGAYRGNVGG